MHKLRDVVDEIRDQATKQRLRVLPYEIKMMEPSPVAIVKDLNTTMASLTPTEKSDECVAHALEVRSSWALANFRRFFRLYNHAPRMSSHLISWFADRERKLALKTLIKAYVFRLFFLLLIYLFD
ncbi:hypothetical protein OUZ56_008830 [Daphnia magna]|uniref:Ribonuclease PIN domain-containing protein n=1 Tax=Daphnia magna TaxID=35525 RepID=A0ABR0AE71_9CRUS|nr:hypothetical protein OUZ56_008830 [Daphnia magna]